eukprot:gene2599-3559_t
MSNYEAAVYGQIINKSRSIASVSADVDHHRFLVGSHSFNSNNEVHLIDYLEDSKNIWCIKIFPHENEIWSLSPSPIDQSLFWSIHNDGNEFKTTLWKMPEEEESVALKQQIELSGFEERLHTVLWHPSLYQFDVTNIEDRVITVDTKYVKEWNFNSQKNESKSLSEYKFDSKVNSAKWDPHHLDTVAVACGKNIEMIDLKTNKTSVCAKEAHDGVVSCLEYNPYNPYQLCSGGHEGKVKIFDVRKTTDPLKVLHGHSHWITNIKYNSVHDEMLITSSTDSIVNLWYLPSICFKEAQKNEGMDEEVSEL